MSEMVSRAYHEAKLAEAYRQIAALQETVLDLRRKLLTTTTRFPTAWGLWRSEAHVLALLIDAAPEAVGRERLFIALTERIDREMNDALLSTRIGMIRAKLAKLGFGRIEPRYKVGYYMSADDASHIKSEAARLLALDSRNAA